MARWIVVLMLACLVGCGGDMTSKPAESDSVGSLQTRDHIIRLETGQRYSVFTADGRVLAQSLDAVQFRQRFPDLYDDLQKAVADLTSTDPDVLDGRR